ncbi:hypothetical protein M9H77_03310 [Catharanthus roseus]|uniref:Uncharacterized protein n=1 Tax=Catharanthus roseus TaxID=4058 RepID=A0ACC0CB19_CATRO|nr:hypothetical protein M9H77_03310 [Catharanthus roseus]
MARPSHLLGQTQSGQVLGRGEGFLNKYRLMPSLIHTNDEFAKNMREFLQVASSLLHLLMFTEDTKKQFEIFEAQTKLIIEEMQNRSRKAKTKPIGDSRPPPYLGLWFEWPVLMVKWLDLATFSTIPGRVKSTTYVLSILILGRGLGFLHKYLPMPPLVNNNDEFAENMRELFQVASQVFYWGCLNLKILNRGSSIKGGDLRKDLDPIPQSKRISIKVLLRHLIHSWKKICVMCNKPWKEWNNNYYI